MSHMSVRSRPRVVLFLAVGLADSRDACKEFLARDHGVAKHHEETTYYAQIAQEESHVEDETVTKTLDDDDGQQPSDSVFRLFLENDR